MEKHDLDAFCIYWDEKKYIFLLISGNIFLFTMSIMQENIYEVHNMMFKVQ